MSYLLLILVLMTPAFADLDKIHIKNLDLNYIYPQGSGDFEKLSIGLELKNQTYPVSVYRKDHSIDIISPFVDFQWLNPFAFIHNAQKLSTKKLHLNIDHKLHYVRGELLTFTPEKSPEIILDTYDVTCQGTSVAKDPLKRISADCLENLEARVKHLELPFEFFQTLSQELPDVPVEDESDMPADDFSLNVKKGDFYSHLRIKIILRAYLKIWGHTKTEDEGKTLAIRVDEIKYGVLPVTTIVMNELRRQVRHPDVKIDPPWIRIKLGNK